MTMSWFKKANPADSKVFCVLPWVHMNVATDGGVFPCCVAAGDPVGSVRRATLQEIWNSPGMRHLRRRMLRGKPSPQCVRCYEYERAGVRSNRLDANRRLARHLPLAQSTAADGGLADFRLPYLDVRFSNLCNFRCRSCGPASSDSWHEDALRLRLKSRADPEILRPWKDPQELWAHVEPLLADLESIYFAGGEPLLQDEHYRILDWLLERKMTRVRLRYNTNFSVTHYKGRDVMRLWDQFEDVSIGASLDGAGRRGEYLRKGQRWAQVVANRRRMLQTCPRAKFGVETVVSVMNVLHVPDFHREWFEQWPQSPDDGFSLFPLQDPPRLSVRILPPEWKRRVGDRYRDYIETVLRPSGPHGDFFRRQLLSVVDFMTAEDLSWRLESFQDYTRRLDELRGEDFAATFPELAGLMKHQARRNDWRRGAHRLRAFIRGSALFAKAAG